VPAEGECQNLTPVGASRTCARRGRVARASRAKPRWLVGFPPCPMQMDVRDRRAVGHVVLESSRSVRQLVVGTRHIRERQFEYKGPQVAIGKSQIYLTRVARGCEPVFVEFAVNNRPEERVSAVRYLWIRLRRRGVLLLAISLFLIIATGWLTNVPALLLGHIVDSVATGSANWLRDIFPIIGWISAAIVLREVLIWARKFAVEKAATELERDEFVLLIAKLLSLNPNFMVAERIGGLNVRIHRSIEGIVKLLKLQFLEFMPPLASGIIAMILAASKNWPTALIMLAVALLEGVVTWRQVISQQGIRIQLFSAKEAIGAKVTELLWGIEYVRASGLQPYEIASSEALARELARKEFKHHKWMMTFDAGKQLIEGTGFVAVIAYSAWLAARGFLSKGDVLSLTVLYGSVAAPIRDLHRIVDEGFESILKARELVAITQLPSDSMLCGTAEPIRDDPCVVSASGLSVAYVRPDQTAHKALRNLTVSIQKGEKIGIAGESGSGKSTFVKVVLGLIGDFAGDVTVFGRSVKLVDKAALAALIAYVPQRPFLLHGTVRHNVAYGAESTISDERAWAALRHAHIDDLINSLPGKLDAPLAEQGRNLSGGEQQRIVLARAFLRGAELVVLDEATAALDNENERLVQEAIEELAAGKTTITVAHRLSTLRGTDRILVFDEGEIVQDGPYHVLADAPGVFKRLVEQEVRNERSADGRA
jgi:ATP-binding cassette subfamily B protein